MYATHRFAARALLALTLLVPLAAQPGCAKDAAGPATPANLEGDAASLQFGLRVEAGDGTMVKATEEAVRNALVGAGFRLGEEADADVVLELRISDVDAPQFIQMTVNGKQVKKRAVTTLMKAVDKDGKTVVQAKRHTFKVTDGDPVEDGDVRGLVGQFTKNDELNRMGLEVQIARAESKVGKKKSEPQEEQQP